MKFWNNNAISFGPRGVKKSLWDRYQSKMGQGFGGPPSRGQRVFVRNRGSKKWIRSRGLMD